MSRKFILILIGAVIVLSFGVGAYVAYRPAINANGNSNTNVSITTEKIDTTLNVVSDTVSFSYAVKVSLGVTAFQQIMQAAQENGFVVDKKDYASGPMITGIGGKNATDPGYWSFEINGTSAMEGAGTYKLKAGDVVTMRYVP